ncbi:MFS transporter [Paenibacillus sp. Marseille-Q4541]|uniref:MFS transporter n=1 Tax=Paenibacillus sp. Marseille-Q4541 TaxID=2831522 RepID=UPI00201A081E|nr:MFS transporter [Paenibacillus sp. Marseille-Q4541]
MSKATGAIQQEGSKAHFSILIAIIIVAGLSQGLLLPVLSIFIEQMGVSSSMNGLNAAVMYVGSFAMTLVAERILGAVGFKKLIVSGLIVVMIPLMLFPLIPDLRLWFVLRLLVGIGDSALHYATQLWVLLVTPAGSRGRNISIYGMSYGIGFSIGPLGIKLLGYGQVVPFAILFFIMLIVLLFALKLPDTRPEKLEHEASNTGRYRKSFMFAWYALIPAFLYGYMESGMNSNFPIYGLRIGFSESDISTLLPFVGIGGLLLQLPLGALSDRYGRKQILMISGILGGLLFMLIPSVGTEFWPTLLLLTVAGGLVGSFFSLGLAYAADILPKSLLPAANVVGSFQFNIGSILGPNLGGIMLGLGVPGAMFWLLGSCYLLFGIAGVLFKRDKTMT